MKISEYIRQLEAIQNEHGDLDVETVDILGDRITARSPKLDYRATLKGREHKPRFASWFLDDRKGEKVCRV